MHLFRVKETRTKISSGQHKRTKAYRNGDYVGRKRVSKESLSLNFDGMF